MNEHDLDNAIQSLPRRIEPKRDLWPAINARLTSPGMAPVHVTKTPVWRMPAIAAALLVALTTGVIIGRGTDAPDTGRMSTLEYSLAGNTEATEREYQAAFRELVPIDYSGMRIAGTDPDAIRGSWKELQKAEGSLLAALKEHPANLFLNERLRDLRSQQLQFVKQMVLLEQNNWRRT